MGSLLWLMTYNYAHAQEQKIIQMKFLINEPLELDE